MEKKCIEKYSKHLKEIETISLKKGFSMGLFTALSSGGQYLLFAIVFYIEINLFRANCEVYRPWDLFLSFSCLLILSGAYFSKSFSYLKEFFEAKTAAKSVFDIIECQPDISTENDKKTLPILEGHVEFEKVYFNYPQRPTVEVLKNLSLKIDAGKTLALVGPSGSGKSTVIGLLQQFYSPTLGAIKIDGVPIDQLNIKWLRDQMALVTQEPVLFSCSIKENIRLGRLEATDAEIEEAARQSNAHNFITKLKNGYETLVGERGIQLSGGQKQRIAIARALIRNPRILLLDEATSALDYQNERIVQEALERAKIGRTTIIIAHRLSTIRNADLIVCVRDGEQAEMGNHDELMNRKGLYYEMVVSQTFKKIELEGVSREDSIQASEASIEGLKRPISVGQIEKESKPSIEIFKYEKKILTNHLPESFWLASGVLASIIIGLIFVSIRYLFNDVWDVFYILDDEKQIQESIKYTLILVLLTLIYALMQTYSSYSIERCGCRLTTRLRSKLFESMLRQEVAFHDQQQYKSSLLTTRLSTGPDSCRALTSDLFVLVSQKLTVLVAAVIICLFLSWKLTVVASAFLLVSMCVSMASFHVTTKISTGGGGEYEQGRLGVETIENIRTMISLNLEKFFIGQFEKSNDKVNLLMMNTHAFLYSMSNCMLFFLQASLFTVGFILAQNDGLSISEFFKINSILVLASVDLLELFTRFPNLQKAIQSAKSVFEIVERQSNIDPFSEKGLKPHKTIGKLRFDNVHFTYPSRPDEPVLQGLNLCVNKGEVNALVGYSGAGKSTIVGLLLRFYDVNSGAIYLDDVDIRDLNIQWLRSQIGLVSQEPSLFNISIYENICFGDLSRIKIEMHEVVDSATRSSIHNKIELLPEKYDTPVGSKGSQQLSGGEKQRIAIARALIRKPNILLLDEATSSLDSQSELIVQEVLDKAKEGRTCIVIAHRLATIRNSNKISVMKDGKVVEEGSHDELINLKGVYFRLLHSA